jgi:hypothetical protein
MQTTVWLLHQGGPACPKAASTHLRHAEPNKIGKQALDTELLEQAFQSRVCARGERKMLVCPLGH